MAEDLVLDVRGLMAGHGRTQVVHGIDLRVQAGEVVALLGPNGAGKTTTLLTLAGYLPKIAGEGTILGNPLGECPAHLLVRRGLGMVHDDRALFGSLSVRENLELARRSGDQPVDEIFALFPALAKRSRQRAQSLSGGEQQMLAIGRALVQAPRLLMVDEMSMGLAPIIVESLLQHVCEYARSTGAGVLLVEQHVRLALRSADRAVVLVHGEIVLDGSARELRADPQRLHDAYLSGQPVDEPENGS